MKKLGIIVIALLLSGCAHWQEMSETEKQAWIFGGAIVLGAVALSQQEDNTTIVQSNDPCVGPNCRRGN